MEQNKDNRLLDSNMFPLIFLACFVPYALANPMMSLAARDNCPNTTFHLSSAQIKAASLSSEMACQLEQSISSARANWATSVHESFYVDLPANTSSAVPGDILKVESFTDPALFTLPAGIAISRFVYVSETMNGTAVPASAFVLWPFHPAQYKGINGVPTVIWAHGSSGANAECGPSHYKNLYYQFDTIYELALAGFAVVGQLPWLFKSSVTR